MRSSRRRVRLSRSERLRPLTLRSPMSQRLGSAEIGAWVGGRASGAVRGESASAGLETTMSDPFDWYAPLPDTSAGATLWGERYWAKQPAWKRRLRPLIDRWEASVARRVVGLRRRTYLRVRWAFRWPRTEDHLCCGMCRHESPPSFGSVAHVRAVLADLGVGRRV